MEIKNINEKQTGDCGYVAGYMNKQIGVYGSSLLKAKEKAEAHFKPSKKNKGLLWITLAEDAQGNTVNQSTAI